MDGRNAARRSSFGWVVAWRRLVRRSRPTNASVEANAAMVIVQKGLPLEVDKRILAERDSNPGRSFGPYNSLVNCPFHLPGVRNE